MKIKDVMNKNVKCCSADSTLEQIAGTMWNDDVGVVPIVDSDQKLTGIVTDRDIAMAATLKHRPLWEISAKEMVAGKTCKVCHPEDDVHEALQLMNSHRIRRVPVVDQSFHLAGIVGLKDIAMHAIAQAGPKRASQLSAEEFVDTFRHISKPNELNAIA